MGAGLTATAGADFAGASGVGLTEFVAVVPVVVAVVPVVVAVGAVAGGVGCAWGRAFSVGLGG